MAMAPVVFTVDVESDWGTAATEGVERVLPRLLDRLHRRGARATFFVVGKLAPLFKRHFPAGPHEVASHGLTHAILTEQEDAAVAHEVAESKRLLEEAGFSVHGFRAPFLKAPNNLPAHLERAGYGYDSSGGSVWPSLKVRRMAPENRSANKALRSLPPSTLRGGWIPFSLTYLRLLHPLGIHLLPRGPAVFFCHLHEFLPPPGGWHAMPFPFRMLHGLRCGETAWRILDRLLSRSGRTFITCKEFLDTAP